eukprot:259123_1
MSTARILILSTCLLLISADDQLEPSNRIPLERTSEWTFFGDSDSAIQTQTVSGELLSALSNFKSVATERVGLSCDELIPKKYQTQSVVGTIYNVIAECGGETIEVKLFRPTGDGNDLTFIGSKTV